MPAISSRGRGRRTINEINMVPFIDVMLVLLIIFMVTAPMITPSVVDLPSVGKAAKQPDQVIQIVVQKDDSLEMVSDSKTQKINLESLANSVRVAQTGQVHSAVVISHYTPYLSIYYVPCLRIRLRDRYIKVIR